MIRTITVGVILTEIQATTWKVFPTNITIYEKMVMTVKEVMRTTTSIIIYSIAIGIIFSSIRPTICGRASFFIEGAYCDDGKYG